MKRWLPIILVLLFPPLFACTQLSLSPSVVNFFTIFARTEDSISVTITNNSGRAFTATDVNLFHDAFWVWDTAFSVPNGGSHTFWVHVNARHNLRYFDYGLVESSTHPDGLQFTAFANVRYPNPYYDDTKDKSHEDLKAALKTILTTGYNSWSYNKARDFVFMDIDNQAVNGQGAGTNTIECVYTGRTVTGYTSRPDAQTSGNFNTEHTIPQSLFSQNLPMLSDMHHLFATYAPANTERGNKPYGMVANPSWQDGGSKSNGSTFEPRDAQKGVAARTMFYFVLRYQDYNGFAAGQESILRQWSAQFPPTAIDSARNDTIFGLQNNRNPFVDHPEFLESGRIAAVTTTDNGPTAAEIHTVQTLEFGAAQPGVPVTGYLNVSNQGPVSDLLLSNFVFSDPAWSFPNTPNGTIPIDTLRSYAIAFDPPASNTNYTGTLTFDTNDPAHPSVTVDLSGNSNPVGILEELEAHLSVSPNPFQDYIRINADPIVLPATVRIVSVAGQILQGFELDAQNSVLDVAGLPSGLYLLQISAKNGIAVRKMHRL